MSELIHQLAIDWKLLLAQVVNFLILLFLLKKFLYRPIIELLRRRREAVIASQENTERIARELAGIEARKAGELDKAKREADSIVQEAKKHATARQAEMLKEAESRIEKMLAEAKKRAEEERAKILEEVRDEVADLVFLATEKVLSERLPRGAHERFIEETIGALRHP